MNYGEYLAAHCGGAILQWIIDGARMFIRANFRIPEPDCVKEAVQAYRQDNDWLTNFLEDCCDRAPEYTQRAGEVYDAYRRWCEDKREWTRSVGDFKAALTGAGFRWQKAKTGNLYFGLRLKESDEEEGTLPF